MLNWRYYLRFAVFVGFVVLSAAILVYLFTGSPSKASYFVPELQISKHQWPGEIDEEYIAAICKMHDIDPNSAWRIECPKCESAPRVAFTSDPVDDTARGAYLARYSEDSWEVVLFYAAYPDKPGYVDVFCAGCGYPVGTDWRVIERLNNGPG